MARTAKNNRNTSSAVTAFHYGDATRLNIPEATEPQAVSSKGRKPTYRYSPHLSPRLRFDCTGASDQVPAIIEKVLVGQTPTNHEREILRTVGQHAAQPWLEWAAKEEQQASEAFTVDDVALHIHERISAQAILATARREDLSQQDFFARPKLHREQALQYYQHGVDWANRLILGDSLHVMSSLANRENLAGQVQMIYFDPPYGIKFSSNWQNEVGERTVKDKEEDITREPEMIRAYRDTWNLGVHSYLAYLRQRLIVARTLLNDSGSIFVQISDENVHRVRALLDEVFLPKNQIATIAFKKAAPQTRTIKKGFNYILWFAKNANEVQVQKIYRERGIGEGTTEDPKKLALWLRLPNGAERSLTTEEKREEIELPPSAAVFRADKVRDAGKIPEKDFPFTFEGETLLPGSQHSWRGKPIEMERLSKSERLLRTEETLAFKLFTSDSGGVEITSLWEDTAGKIPDMLYVVQTNAKVIARCMLMTTKPGDLVMDPTCGSGTTAFVAEEWGRRWITIDSSRVAVAIARQRVLTRLFESYKTKDPLAGVDPAAPQNPAFGFYYKTVPHITLKSIAQNQNLDPIFAKHDPIIAAVLKELNAAVAKLGHKAAPLHAKLVDKLRNQFENDGARSISDADLRRWLLPGTDDSLLTFATTRLRMEWKEAIPAGPRWQDWEVPFDTDPDWPEPLQTLVTRYRTAWRSKMNEVNSAIRANAEQEDLVNKPESIGGVGRVSGPFSVESVRPQELGLGEDGKLYDPTADPFDESADAENADAYIDLMIGLLRRDGVTFLGNRHAEFASLEKEAGRSFHARGCWKGTEDGLENVAVVFGPQYGPINAPLAVDAIGAARDLKEITELVLAGFSFDAAAQEKAKEMGSDALRIHLAHIRPDVSPGMHGLLKETPNSQLFTVFGQPDIRVMTASNSEFKVEMNGVCIYNPLTGEISESSNKKVAAWFLDTDYDGHCFCISQAFFPDKDAWSKIAKALGASISDGLFEDFTISWPFKAGKHKRIAVKVIDPRGNEVIAIKTLST